MPAGSSTSTPEDNTETTEVVKIDNVTNVEGQATSDGDFKERTIITTELMEEHGNNSSNGIYSDV